jgi:hypothetical protein
MNECEAQRLVDEATGEHTSEPESHGKDPAAVALGCEGQLRGGKARAAEC